MKPQFSDYKPKASFKRFNMSSLHLKNVKSEKEVKSEKVIRKYTDSNITPNKFIKKIKEEYDKNHNEYLYTENLEYINTSQFSPTARIIRKIHKETKDCEILYVLPGILFCFVTMWDVHTNTKEIWSKLEDIDFSNNSNQESLKHIIGDIKC